MIRDAPILDPMLVTFKMTEYFVAMKQLGIPILSRIGIYKKPPVAEIEYLRDYLAKHDPPEKVYSSKLIGVKSLFDQSGLT